MREASHEGAGGSDRDGVAVVVPAFQEAESIGGVVRALRARGYRVIVVDDGSTDRTRDAALAAGAKTLSHPINRGQGAAIQTGIDFAVRSGADYVVTFDADGQHDPEDVERLLRTLRDTGKDIALGSRFLGRAENITLARRLLLRAATLFTNLTTRVRLTDAHNGLRAMTAATAASIEIRQDGMAHASEIIHQIGAKGLEWVEVPVTVRYTEYSKAKGQSAFGSISVLYNLLTGRLR
jgi:glycosyltransferase involved in cell wall biosynthesis